MGYQRRHAHEPTSSGIVPVFRSIEMLATHGHLENRDYQVEVRSVVQKEPSYNSLLSTFWGIRTWFDTIQGEVTVEAIDAQVRALLPRRMYGWVESSCECSRFVGCVMYADEKDFYYGVIGFVSESYEESLSKKCTKHDAVFYSDPPKGTRAPSSILPSIYFIRCTC